MDTERALPLGCVRGINVKAHWSLIVIFGLLTWSLAAAALPELAHGYTAGLYWIAAALTTVAFLGSLLAHELSHSFVARSRGIEVHDITLWLLGGVSRLEEEPSTASDDLSIALAGPATSIGIAMGGFVLAFGCAVVGAPHLVIACLLWLASINVLLAIFNLVPAAPLDGGRVLRAFLWKRRGDRVSAAISATKAGRVFAYMLVFAGFVEFAFGLIGGVWFVLLGWFLLTAARAEETQIRLQHDLAGVRVRNVMTADPVTVPSELTAEQVLHDYVLGRHCSSFPVVDSDGDVVGLVTMRQLRALSPSRRHGAHARDIAVPLSDVPQATPEELLLDVLRRTMGATDGRILVVTDGRVVGIVSPSDVARAIEVADLQSSH